MRISRLVPPAVGFAALIAAACTVGVPAAPTQEPTVLQATPTVETGPAESPAGPAPTPEPTARRGRPTPVPGLTPTPTPTPSPRSQSDEPPPGFRLPGWDTDLSKHSVPFGEILSTGLPADAIPPIDSPVFAGVADAPDYMTGQAPVIALEINGESKAYPLAILMWHEIVNDETGGVPVAVTYCPLRNTAIIFDRRVDGATYTFGTSGFLRNSDLVMWDRQTESWWQQITGEAIVGELTGARLGFIAAPVISWDDYVAAFPLGKVLTRDTGFSRSYDFPPYRGYDDPDSSPFLFAGTVETGLPPMERVVGLVINGDSVAYPFTLLDERTVTNDTVGGEPLVIFHVGATRSPFSVRDSEERKAVGSTGVFEPLVDGEMLIFTDQGGAIVDEETGSTWNILGQATDGPLRGTRLTPIVHANHFWFAWAAFNPGTTIRTAEDLDG